MSGAIPLPVRSSGWPGRVRPWLLILCLLPLNPVLAEEPVPVTAVPLGSLLMHPQSSAPAVVVARRDSLLSAAVGALVREVVVRVGDRVAAGAPVVVQDDRAFRLEVVRAEATLNELRVNQGLAERQLDRARTLEAKGQASAELLDRRRVEAGALAAAIQRQEAALAAARLDMDQCRITAPFAGQVVERLAHPGSWAGPGTPLVRLVDTDAPELAARLDSDQAAGLSRHREWWFVRGDGRLALELRVLLDVVAEGARTREARFDFRGQTAPVGSAGRLEWTHPVAHLPPDLLVRRDAGLGVFLLRDGRAHFLPLPGSQEGRPAPLPGSLDPAVERVILAGREGLRHDQPVVPEGGE
ncbi:MAG: efflux RND transporter periplasmic adaptor subunit [Magnetococcales bacterium]|nr:efflux RND transporter periplasmic adaptor subunit [Magnetococcales bacterium]